MSFQRSKKTHRRNQWRTIFIWIIGLTLPCYLLAFFVYAFASPQVDQIIDTTEFVTATWTPIDPNTLLTQRALTNVAPTDLPVFASNTPFGGFTAMPPDFFTPDVFATSTTVPTRFVTSVPSNTPIASATPQPTIAQPTVAPTDAPPIILPPTDTPNP